MIRYSISFGLQNTQSKLDEPVQATNYKFYNIKYLKVNNRFFMFRYSEIIMSVYLSHPRYWTYTMQTG